MNRNRLVMALALCAPFTLATACGETGAGPGREGQGAGRAAVTAGGTTGNTGGTVLGGKLETPGGMSGGGGALGGGGSPVVWNGGAVVSGGAQGGTGGAVGGSGSGGGLHDPTLGGGGAGGAPGMGGAGGRSNAGGNPSAGAVGVGGQASSGGAIGLGGVGTAGTAGGDGGRGGKGGTAGVGGNAAGGSVGGDSGSGGKGGASGAGGDAGSAGTTEPTGALITNDVFWKDSSGNPIYSQGGGVLQVGDTYYWYGVRYGGAETYFANPTRSNSDTSFVAVTIYSSTDLAHWKFEGNALDRASVSASVAMESGTWIGRVGAAYNPTTQKYVLIGQYLGTPDTTQFFATSDTPNGTFTWDHTQATITNVTNDNCGDQSVFTDDDGQAYIVCSSLSGRSNLYIIPLRPDDFLEAQPATRIFGGAGREGNAMFKANGRYYVCSSDLHGWNASHAYYISATNILGPYEAEGVIGNTDLDFSHVTQTGLFVTVRGSTQELVVFGGDRWSDFAGNGVGYNQWMPLTFNGTAPVMQSLSEWTIDVATGTWAIGPGNNFVMNPSFEADRTSITTPAGWTPGGGSNATGGHTGRWSWQLSGSLDQTITGLPNGTYTLGVWAKGASGTLYAKGFGGTDQSTALTAGSSWTQVSLSDIAVSNGTCEVGITSGSGNVDDFTLIQQ